MSGIGLGLTALSTFGKIRNAFGAVVGWVFRSTTHILLVVLTLVLLWVFHQHRTIRGLRTDVVSLQTAYRAEKLAFAVEHANVGKLKVAIAAQNKAVAHLAEDSAARVEAAQRALRGVEARSVKAIAHAHAIDAEGAESKGTAKECPSGRAVLAAKGEL